MKESVIFIVRAAIFVVCVYTLYQLFPVVLKHIQGQNCPMIGFVPACYVVFAGYLAMAFSVTINPKKTAWLFYPGWVPVFLFAFTGTSLEIMGRPTCPATSSGIPLCYFSLAISIALVLGYLFTRGRSLPRL